jgi:hypothetical protein
LNPHIFVKFQEEDCYKVTFLNGESVVLGDKLELLCKEGDEEYFMPLDCLKFGIKVAFTKTPQSIINKNKHLLVPLIKDLLYKIENEGIVREINEDATYIDMISEWKNTELKEYIFSLYNIGIYIHVKKCSSGEDKNILTLDSDNLNYIFFNDSVEDISTDIINSMEECKKIIKLKNKMNIDKERDFVKVVKNIKKVKSVFLCKKIINSKIIDCWNSIVIDGILVKHVTEF